MTEPTDRERVAWALCEATDTANPHCGMSVPCPDCLRVADAAIALGAKPPVDPVEVLADEALKMWAYHFPFNPITPPVKLALEQIVRHVIARVKDLGL